MNRRSVVLINSNEMRPPVAPIALDYIGDRLRAADYQVHLVDLCFTGEPDKAIAQALAGADPIAIGITFRNTDDCFWPSQAWFVPRLQQIVTMVRAATAAPIVLGGCGFSIFPVQLFEACGADLAIVGDGEETFLQLVARLETGQDYTNLPGLLYRNAEGRIHLNPLRYGAQLDLPSRRGTIENARYLREGGMGNIETKRGCPRRCIYCADPLAKGRNVRCRPASQVADEMEALLRQGVDVLHFCDSEFNIPPSHAMAVCEEIITRNLGSRVRWYTYASVEPFSDELASAMRRAGCVGINFGADSGCDRMLATLARPYRREDIRHAVECCRRAGITVMLDLLIGGPGEDEASVAETIAFIKAIGPDRAGAATGVRIYPGTQLAKIVAGQGPLPENPNLRGCVEQNEDLLRPVFYLDRALGDDPAGLVIDLIGEDERFFKPAPSLDTSDYNYNDNTVLEEAIRAGCRGAFWDVLRKL